MENVAGLDIDKTDKILEDELKLAGIDIVRHNERISHPEVNTHISGKLNGWEFRRNWYYWVGVGMMPIEIARDIFALEAGKRYIRAGGDCTCPPPDSYVKVWILGGRKVIPEDEEDKFKKLINDGLVSRNILEEYIFSDDPEGIGANAFVESYHVDTQLGLYILAEKIKLVERAVVNV